MLLLNSMVGLILSSYAVFNWMVNDFVILVNVFLLIYLSASNIKDGFKFGVSFLFLIMAILQFLLGLFMESTFNDNWLLIILLITFFTQIGLMLVVKSLSRYA